MKAPFDIDKAAQCAHFFASRAGGEIEILKLVKLMYLTDRRSLELRRVAVMGGSYYSLKHGPVTGEVLELINDGTRTGDSPWEQLISDRANHRVATAADCPEYDALSSYEMNILEEVWAKFGHQGTWDLVDWTHRHCEEWSDPSGGRLEISSRKLAESFMWKPSEVEEFEEELAAANRLHALLN